MSIHRPIFHTTTVTGTPFLSFPPLAQEGSSSGHKQSSTTFGSGVALTNNSAPPFPSPRVYLLDDAHATAYSYGPSISTGFIVLHSSLLRDLDLEKPPSANSHLVAFIIAHEIGHLLLYHHLESVSQMLFYSSLGEVLVDFFQSIFYPFFVMFGPFVEEGMRAMGRVAITEGRELVHLCFSTTMEIEADFIALRSVAKNKTRRRSWATHRHAFTQVIGPGRLRSSHRLGDLGEQQRTDSTRDGPLVVPRFAPTIRRSYPSPTSRDRTGYSRVW